ncbi:MAG: trehalose-phosphatase [Rhodobiaceae bacterium]|nr:trehalose-phosphatase [Rhodobiaceae bacterium]
MTESPDLPRIDTFKALFLDFDGTLVPFAQEPDGIVVPTFLPGLLIDLAEALDGALALVSGRSIENIDRHLGGLPLAIAGEHGGQVRRAGGPVTVRAAASFGAELERARRTFSAIDGVLVETKAAGFAVHYRKAPAAMTAVTDVMNRMVEDRPDLELIHGKCVCELRTTGISKAGAINDFMHETPFSDRVPIFAGDDTTDEDGFRTVNALGGESVKVGEGETCARWRVGSVSQVHAWLTAERDRLAGPSGMVARD